MSRAGDDLNETVCKPLGLALDAGQLERLLLFEVLLERWTATYNLTSLRGRDAIRRQHLADCLAVVGPVARELERSRPASGDTPHRLLDVGSGGGLPGAVMAIALPRVRVSCIDAVGKKAAFVRHVAAQLDLGNLQGLHGRVEAFRPAEPFDLVICRAWTSLDAFVALTSPLLAPHGKWAAMKSRRVMDETMRLPAEVEVFHVEPLVVPLLEGERCIVWMQPTHGDPATSAPSPAS